MGTRIQILALIYCCLSPCIEFYIPCFGCNLLRRFNKIIPSDTATDTAARAPKPAITPTAADESTRPPCAAFVATAVPADVLMDVELLLDKVKDSRSAVTVTVCAGGWAVMKAVAVTVGLVDPVSELQEEIVVSNFSSVNAFNNYLPVYRYCGRTRGAPGGCGGCGGREGRCSYWNHLDWCRSGSDGCRCPYSWRQYSWCKSTELFDFFVLSISQVKRRRRALSSSMCLHRL